MNTHYLNSLRTFFFYSLLFILFFLGFFQSLKNGQDFSVFYFAGKLVLQGSASEIYTESPDRFLYIPGFAWLMAPLALFSWKVGLILWNLIKVISFFGMVRIFSHRLSPWAGVLAILFFSRPLLNELRYGQINLLIVSLGVWAIHTYFSHQKKSNPLRFLAWFFFSLAAFAKLFPALVFLVPGLGFVLSRLKNGSVFTPVHRDAFLGIVFGGVVLLLIPAWTGDLSFSLYQKWVLALLEKGLPLETHNQSFIAFLNHAFSGESFYSLVRGPELQNYSWVTLPQSILKALGGTWTLLSFLFLFWIAHQSLHPEGEQKTDLGFQWGLLLLSACIFPSHLIWKPYFVFFIPSLAVWLHQARGRKESVFFFIGFILVNFTSYLFIGRVWASWVEAYAMYFWISFLIISFSYRALRQNS